MNDFRIYVDGVLFYHPALSELAITEAKIEEDVSAIDTMTLSAPHKHPYCSTIRPLASTIVCKKGDRVAFEGRALDDGTDFYNTHTWTLESSLAYLKDSIQPPYDYKGTLRGLLELFLSEHNKAVEEKKQFTLGTVTVTDPNDYVAYRSSSYSITLDAIKEKLLDTHGGYLTVTYTEGGARQLHYLSSFTSISPQSVEYGKNLLDVAITIDHTKRFSVLLPLGAKIEDPDNPDSETEQRVEIGPVNNHLNYITDTAAVAEIGKIWTTEIWEDVTLPANLLTKAQARLRELSQGITSMELKIVDLSDAGESIADIHAGEMVNCRSLPHGIDGRYPCLSRTRDYLHPSSNTITIGASNVSLSKQSTKQAENLKALEGSVLESSEKITAAKEHADAALQEATQVKEDVSSLQVNVQNFYSEITKTADQITSAVREEFVSRTDLETLKNDFQTGISQTSTEIRMDFLAETNRIRNEQIENQTLLEEYIRFKGALIEMGKIGNAFTAELSNEQLAFKENGQTIAYISNQALVITNAEIRNKISLGNATRGWFDFIPRSTGNLSIVWRGPST